MQLTTLIWLGGLLSLAIGEPQGYAPYGNTSSSSYFPSGTTPFSTGTSSPSADPKPTYGTVSDGLYKRSNSSISGYPTHDPSHHHHPSLFLRSISPPSGTIGSAASTTTIASTGDPSAKTTPASGKLTYTAPKGFPSEYYYHHRKPKRNAAYPGGYGYQA